jgi:O-antigen/teichoic acid export membrane protein
MKIALEGRSDSRRMAPFHRAVARTIIIQMTMMAIATIVNICLSRMLGAEGRGVASWMMAFSGFGSTCVLLGIGQALRKYIAKTPSQAPAFVIVNLMLLALSSVVFLPLLYYGGKSTLPAAGHLHIFYLALLMVPCLAFSSVIDGVLITLGRSLHYNLIYVVERTVNIVLNLIMFFTSVTPLSMIAAYMAAVSCRLLLGMYYLRPYFRHRPVYAELRDAFGAMRRLLFSSYFSNLAIFYSITIMTIALGVLSPPREVGYFAAVKMLTDAIQMIPGVISAFALPQLAKEETEEGHARVKWHLLFITVLAVLPPVSVIFFFPEFVIRVLFGPAFMPAAACLPVMAVGIVAVGIFIVCNSIVASQHNERLVMLASGTLAVAISLLLWIFHGSLDAITASYIYTITFMIGMFVGLVLTMRAHVMPPHA